jgi:hypothetical protein
VQAGKPADVAVVVKNWEEAMPATPGAIRLLFPSIPYNVLTDASPPPPGFAVCGTAAAAASFTPPAKAIKPRGEARFTIPGVPIPAFQPGKWIGFVMVEPGKARARASRAGRRAAAPTRAVA